MTTNLCSAFNAKKKTKKHIAYVEMMVFPEEVGAQTMAECFLSTSLSTRFCHSSSFHPVVKRDRGGSLGVQRRHGHIKGRRETPSPKKNRVSQTRLNDAIWEAPRSPCTRFRSSRVDPRYWVSLLPPHISRHHSSSRLKPPTPILATTAEATSAM